MTELIVALDGPQPLRLMERLWCEAGVNWFKIGPQAMMDQNWSALPACCAARNAKLFLDVKLADTRDTVREAVKRFADTGIAAVSTFTAEATNAALDAGVNVAIWQVLSLSDDPQWYERPMISAPGVICPAAAIAGIVKMREDFRARGILANPVDIVVPGVRLPNAEKHGHYDAWPPDKVAAAGATHAVVGRPIWTSSDPVTAALAYQAALMGSL